MPATSADSRVTPSQGSLPHELNWKTWSCRFFDVEFAEKGEDAVYHFWPHTGEKDFPPEFSTDLEAGFATTCPANADVRAGYVSVREAAALLRFGQKVDDPRPPQPTYWVIVKDLAVSPGADRFLFNEVFSRIELAIKERYPNGPQQDSRHSPPVGGVPPGNRDRSRYRRGR